MTELIEQFWERDSSPDNDCHHMGVVFEAPVNYVDRRIQALRVDLIDPYHKRPPTIRLGDANDTTFNHQPVKEPGFTLRSNEAVLAYKAKRRPVFLFSMPSPPRSDHRGGTQDDAFLCVPLFRLIKYSKEFVLSMKAFKYENLFHVPADGSSGIQEGMVRFDRAHVIHMDNLHRWPRHVKLSSDALLVMQEWFRYYLTGMCEDWLLQHQRIELEKLGEILATSE